MNHFIELPDGTIINVAHVGYVKQSEYPFEGQHRRTVEIAVLGKHTMHPDEDGQVYAYFHKIAQKIGASDE